MARHKAIPVRKSRISLESDLSFLRVGQLYKGIIFQFFFLDRPFGFVHYYVTTVVFGEESESLVVLYNL